MLPEVGHFALILAWCLALTQAFAPQMGSRKHYCSLAAMSAMGQLLLLTITFLCLMTCFIQNDMTVLYVQEHSHPSLPLIYKIGAMWSGHEGSLLLWCCILSGWTVAFMVLSGDTRYAMIRILGMISSGFIAFLLLTSNLFQRIFPNSPLMGNDLTPVLQDPGLIFHPLLLYVGYAGFSIMFALSLCALLEGRFDKKGVRPWIILPWVFLGCGIVLGSWWAYRELGWGGWWFWDPVENASLLPWLSATALLHSFLVSEKHDVFNGWTLLLAIVTFSLCLVGTFLVRSGILVSVHTFAIDPKRGLFLLVYLAILIGGALGIYSLRTKHFFHPPSFQLLSRETFLLANSVILLTAVATVLLGTLYPILLDALNIEKISIGEPYYNLVFLPQMLLILFLMGIAPHVSWGQQSLRGLVNKLRSNSVITFLIALILPKLLGFPFHWLTTLGLFLSVWIITTTLALKNKWTLRHCAMIVAHLGVAVLAIGITLNKSYSEERQVKMHPGETLSFTGYHFIFKTMNEWMGPQYKSMMGTFLVEKNHGLPIPVFAEQRIYHSHHQPFSKAGITFNAWRDIYIVLGAPLPDNDWVVRIYYKPFVRWIWFGGFMLLLGGLLSLLSHPSRHSKIMDIL